MKIEEFKQELNEMIGIAIQNEPTLEDSPWRKGYHVGYIKAVQDMQRFIHQREYLENIEEADHGEQK